MPGNFCLVPQFTPSTIPGSLGLTLIFSGYGEHEVRPVRTGLVPYLTAVLENDFPAEPQTKADTVLGGTFQRPDSPKPGEQLLAIFFSNRSAAVVDVETIMRFTLFKTKRDGAPLTPVLDGIGKEVPVDGLEPGLVGADRNGTGGNGPETELGQGATDQTPRCLQELLPP